MTSCAQGYKLKAHMLSRIRVNKNVGSVREKRGVGGKAGCACP